MNMAAAQSPCWLSWLWYDGQAVSCAGKIHFTGIPRLRFRSFFSWRKQAKRVDRKQILAGIPKAMVAYVEEWFKLHGRQRFSVMGYSIGANIALILLKNMPT
jgi:predicted esterase